MKIYYLLFHFYSVLSMIYKYGNLMFYKLECDL